MAQQVLRATVKAVLSGDTVVLVGQAPNPAVAPPERQLSLAGIIAPKFARGKNAVDEPFAWQSREVLRKKLIGKPVSFQVLYKQEGSGREYGSIVFENQVRGPFFFGLMGDNFLPQDMAQFMVATGWARARPKPEGKENKDDAKGDAPVRSKRGLPFTLFF